MIIGIREVADGKTNETTAVTPTTPFAGETRPDGMHEGSAR